jgi:2-amino-4-hydroxy-6-hydroxymethyldihydropteridine diphosphokinase
LVSFEHNPVLLSMGSNIEPRLHLVLAARRLLEWFPDAEFSRVFETEPIGAPRAPWFLNAAAAIVTDLDPLGLKFQVLRPLEAGLGRQRTADRNAPRTIDLDIAMCGDLVVEDREAGLRLPDPEILTAAHIALPLADLAPQQVHPVTGQTLREIAAQLIGGPLVRPLEDIVLGR